MLKKIFSLGFAVVLTLTSQTTSAVVAGGMAAFKSNWSGYGYQNMKAPMRIYNDGGSGANYYYAMQFYSEYGDGGYIGLQNRSGAHWVNFSIWGATWNSGQNMGGSCRNFGHEGSGVQCDMPYNWQLGKTYTLEYRLVGGSTWEGAIIDDSTGDRTAIGRISIPSSSGWLKGYTNMFVEEYSQGNDQLPNCDYVGHSAMTTYAVVMDNQHTPYNTAEENYGSCGHKSTSWCEGNGNCHNEINQGQIGDPNSNSGGNNGGSGDININTNTYYSIVARHSDKALDVSGGSTDEGANLIQYVNGGGSNQQFIFVSTGNGYYNIVNRKSGLYLDIAGGSTSDGGNIIQWAETGGANQAFKAIALGGGWYRFEVKSSGKVISIASGSTANVANIEQRTWNNSTHQQFKLEAH